MLFCNVPDCIFCEVLKRSYINKQTHTFMYSHMLTFVHCFEMT